MISARETLRAGGFGERVQPNYGYYRQPNGWITMSVVTQLEELQYRREGWTPLSQYGRFEMSSVYEANHPFEALFMQGGAVEMCLEQIVELGYHLNPPIMPSCGRVLHQYHRAHDETCFIGAQPVHFPQLEGLELVPYPCHFCDRVLPTEKAQGQHETVAHKKEKGDTRLAQTLAEALIKGTAGSAQSGAEMLPTPSPFMCGFCGANYETPEELIGHMDAEHLVQEYDGEQEGES